ncbi:tape measure protein [Enterobacter hormaechei]|uniref:tape measure protein n=1 Tax=Enterobacter hormaechei TaxID=158836 RepID=UPI0025B4FB52|nr:tape measure protein [Enterobacter hormaechei]HED3019128.1 tape measure protein [Enterobacter hormaechei subsp. steigerwaltii]MDN3773918.1 tape measure protein [Enterobacter hormaechei]MDN3805776.1 tape measure protein [Enterobacter hormaechei]MDN3823666.1 tape measure protein [Enterobacter hormaechei]HED3471402.1 tape measure protein [Enterobacter hormaechei subsp. steigerwaltii]
MTQNVGDIEYVIKADTAQLLRADKEVVKATDNMQDGFDAADDAAQSLSSSLGELSKIAAAVMAILSVNQVSQYADAWTELNNKLANALRPNEELVDVTERVFNITQQTRSSLEATASLYARLERATRQYGTSVQDLVKLTTIINQGFVVSGATAEEAENAIIQLSQGLASGALRGEEFNSVNEQGNRLIVALADSMGVTIGQMRQLAAEGKLTTDVVVNGLLSQGATIGAEFAKTTTTISQAMQVAGNNITKFIGESSSVKAGVAIFNDAIITASNNISGLSMALTAVAAVMGSRYIGALTMAATAQVRNTASQIAAAKAAVVTTSAAEAQAAAQLRSAQSSKNAATSDLNLAQARLNTLKATAASSVEEVRLATAEAQTIRTQLAQINSEKALEAQRLRAQITEQGRIQAATRMAQLQQASAALTTRLAAAEATASQSRAAAIASAEAKVSAARIALANATGVATAANGRFIASQEASAVASRAASAAAALARGALSLIGGPAGAAMIAAGAIFYFWQKAQQAKQEAIAFADGLDKLNSSLKSLSNTQLRGTIADANVSIRAQKDEIADLESDIASLQNRYKSFTPAAQAYADSMGQGAEFSQRQAEVSDELNGKIRDLANKKDKLARTENTASEANRLLTNNMLSSMGVHDQLIEKGTTLERVQGAVAKAFGNTADEINRANQAGQNFNPKSLQIAPPTADGDKVILNLEEQNELLKIQDERQRAVAKARMAASKVTDNPNQIASAERLAAENYDLQEAEEARRKAQQQNEQQGKSAATQMEANAQKIADYKQRAETAAGATQDLSREQAMLRAEQSLNKSATAGQIDEIRKYAAAEWDAANAVKMRQQAEQGKKFAQQEIVANVTTPDAVTGAVQNPTALIDLQEQQKLAALAKYQTIDKKNTQLYEDAKTAIQEQAANARRKIAVDEANAQTEAIGSILGSASQGFDSLASIIANTSGKSSGAYVAMFAAAKAFAIAQSTLSLNTAIMQAMADPTALTPAQKMANYAAIASAGASLLSNIASVTMSGGRRYGGTVSAGNAYRVNEDGRSEIFQTAGGQQAFIPNQSGKIIPANKVGGSGGVVNQTVHFTINTTGGIDDATMAKMAQMMKKVSLSTIRDQQRPNGLLRRS